VASTDGMIADFYAFDMAFPGATATRNSGAGDKDINLSSRSFLLTHISDRL
jgi:hypothetical protein